jgi:O-antigen/teichoic acid export membrane protein
VKPPEPHLRAALRQSAAWLNVVAKVGGACVSFLLYIVLARTMTPEAFADVAVILAWLAIATSVACFSAPLVLVRFVPDNLAQGRAGLARGVLQFSFLATTAFAMVIAGATILTIAVGAISLSRDLPRSTLLAAALLLPSVLLADLVGILTGLKRAAVAELLVNVLRPALTVTGLAVLWYLGRPPMPAPTVLALYLAASVIMVMVGMTYAWSILPRELAGAQPVFAYREWTRTAAGFMAVAIAVTISERIDILLMGVISSPSEVAAYAVAVRFAQTVAVAVSAAAAVMAPHLVERLDDLRQGRSAELQVLVRDTARTAMHVSIIALAGFALLGPVFLKLFGPHYERAYVPLVVLAVGQVLSTLVGPAAAVATLSGKPRIAIIALTTGIVVSATLNILLVPSYGANGAAFATACGMVVASLVAWARTRREFRVDTSVFRTRMQ